MPLQKSDKKRDRGGGASQDTRLKGEVSTIFGSKGFGYISADDGNEYFFHASTLQNVEWEEVSPGDSVTFKPMNTEKGPRAVKVEVLR